MEKPSSKKAKSFRRFNGTQDHGKAEAVKQHRHDGEERAYMTEAKTKALARRATQDLRSGLIDYSSMSDDQLEEEADRILREAEAEDNSEDEDVDTQNTEDKMSFKTRGVPTIAEVGGRTATEIRASLARVATLDSFEDDDFGDYHDSHVRITNRPR